MEEARFLLKGIKDRVDEAFEDLELLGSKEHAAAVEEAIALLDQGKVRVADPAGDEWVVNEWLKKAILLYFRLRGMETTEAGPLEWHDRIPLKRNFAALGVRVVPPAVARYGSYLEPGVILMPSYVNIGAWVGSGTMVDTWSTMGSCAQVGRDIHIAGGVGIGGVLEPPNARPVIIEDGCFLGSRCVIVDGVRVRREAVIAPLVVLNQSIPIIDVRGSEPVTYHGEVPERAVVLPGTRAREFPAGTFQVSCALIVGERTESTDKRTSLNNALREHGISG